MEKVRLLTTLEEVRDALELSRRVFDEFVAPDYTAQGRGTFYMVTEPEENIARWQSGEYAFYGAFVEDSLAGIAASRASGSHVMLLFVDKAHHRRGIAKRLIHRLIEDAPGDGITVNASPYAVEAYEHMGFRKTGCPMTDKGITFTPMEYTK